ncbi:hypothetical protein A1D31_24260 [Bradyrhizobium liaoningense]|nr:hypothetical protein A1D31_24260 [Bradyrhizobium liaoningense]
MKFVDFFVLLDKADHEANESAASIDNNLVWEGNRGCVVGNADIDHRPNFLFAIGPDARQIGFDRESRHIADGENLSFSAFADAPIGV